MKKSDMIKKIHDTFLGRHVNSMGPDWAEELLAMMEEVGMLPPPKWRAHDWNETGFTYSQWLLLPSKINEWEPEDEEK